jgi:hypothetical protein
MHLRSAVAAILLTVSMSFAATVVLQQGSGYSGAKDIEVRDPTHNYNSTVFPILGREILSIIESNW